MAETTQRGGKPMTHIDFDFSGLCERVDFVKPTPAERLLIHSCILRLSAMAAMNNAECAVWNCRADMALQLAADVAEDEIRLRTREARKPHSRRDRKKAAKR
ncbi:MAG: hypothetical protein ACI4P6_03445 [Candidatus Spyradosoma sp.]